VRIGQEDVTALPPNKRDTATVFQSYGLFPHMTVGENVAYGLAIQKKSRDEIQKKTAATLAMVGLADYAARSCGQLSGGQQQRVALARSLIVEPAVLLLDEPLSNLDALLREQMRVEIRRIQRELGITAVYVTHDRIEAMSLSDKVIVMKDGVIQQTGSPEEIYERPDSCFVASFVGRAAFFPVDSAENAAEGWVCQLQGKRLTVKNAAAALSQGVSGGCTLMARPESLRLVEGGAGYVEGRVKFNVYLGHSIETYVETSAGEVLVQIDDPASKKIYGEGAAVSIAFDPSRVRLLKA
jgi:iron(III) transport system ATP-binding protein